MRSNHERLGEVQSYGQPYAPGAAHYHVILWDGAKLPTVVPTLALDLQYPGEEWKRAKEGG
jgi:hypothetical protein